MAAGNVQDVLGRLKMDKPFMQEVSNRTQSIKDRIASSPETQALKEHGYTQEFLERMAKQ